MRPPNFDQHCKACHRLGIEGYDEQIEHGIASSQIASKLESLIRSTKPKALPQSLDPSKIESLTANRPRLPRPVELQWPRAEIVVESNPQERLRQAMVALRRNCHQCHGFVELPSRRNPLPDVLPANIKSQKENDPWMPGARFDHRTHDTFGMKCTECHFLGDKPGLTVLLSETSKDVLIPKRQVCLACHTEDAKDTAEARSRGGTSCLLCHNYHRLN